MATTYIQKWIEAPGSAAFLKTLMRNGRFRVGLRLGKRPLALDLEARAVVVPPHEVPR